MYGGRKRQGLGRRELTCKGQVVLVAVDPPVDSLLECWLRNRGIRPACLYFSFVVHLGMFVLGVALLNNDE